MSEILRPSYTFATPVELASIDQPLLSAHIVYPFGTFVPRDFFGAGCTREHYS